MSTGDDPAVPAERPSFAEDTVGAEGSESEEQEEPEGKNVFDAIAELRNQWSQKQAVAFGNLGHLIGSWPWVFGLITPAIWFSLGFGVLQGTLQTDVDKLWVNFGSRLERDLDWYDATYGGLSRPHLMIWTDKVNGTAGNVLTTEALNDVKLVDHVHLDMGPWYDPNSTCAQFDNNRTACNEPGASFGGRSLICLWVPNYNIRNPWDGRCLEHDPMGLKPSGLQKSAITVRYKGVDWGLREICRERKFGGFTGSIARAPCSTQAWPMDCFDEPPVSFQTGIIGDINSAGSWKSNHNASYMDEERRGIALAQPCKGWSGTAIPKGFVLGGVEEVNGTVVRVGGWRAAMQLVNAKNLVGKLKYIMNHPASGPEYRRAGFPEEITVQDAENILDAWEEKAHHVLMDLRDQMNVTELTFTNIWGTAQVIKDASNRNKGLVVVGFTLLAGIVWMYLFRCSMINSRLALGLAGIICIALAVWGTMGTAALLGIEFNGLTLQVLPYVTMGLGIDDMFVVVHYFRPPKMEEEVPFRLQHAYGQAGPSVLATSLVNLTVFLSSLIVPVGAVRSFSWQASIAVVVNFTTIFFGFGAYMAIDARRIASQRFDVFCCLEKDPPPLPPPPPGTESKAPTLRPRKRKKRGSLHIMLRSPDVLAGRAMRSCSFAMIGTLPGRIMVVLSAAAAVTCSIIYGAMDLDVGLPLSQFVEEGGPEQAYLKARSELLPYGAEGAVYIGGMTDTPWNAAHVQEKMNHFFGATLNHPQNWWKEELLGEGRAIYADPHFLVGAAQWSLNFRKFALSKGFGKLHYAETLSDADPRFCPAEVISPKNCVVDPDKFYEMLGVWCGESDCHPDPSSDWCRSTFPSALSKGSGAVYCDDLVLRTKDVAAPGGGTVKVCDGIVLHQSAAINMPGDLGTADISIECMEESRGLVDEMDIGMSVIGRVYLYNEQYRFSHYNLRMILAIALSVATAILAVLFQSVAIAVCQTASISAAIMCIIAFVKVLELRLNAVTLLSIVFGISINVELSVHIARAFDVLQIQNKAERASAALFEMGAPVLCGAFTTFLSVLVLAFSDTQFFRDYFFKFYSCMVAISLFFAATLLPALLSLFGPPPLSPWEPEPMSPASPRQRDRGAGPEAQEMRSPDSASPLDAAAVSPTDEDLEGRRDS
eukprot:TRINITY_DN7658_c0_g2_i1.p1 TRINITY_DN7658_c0_g2~~TRINITY_DN7658_c0_g2_i1.p1  ORF type:complete len:1160 (+),score=325.57 TRINITY_DN7658_c0_g2_i1:167-3646(+)